MIIITVRAALFGDNFVFLFKYLTINYVEHLQMAMRDLELIILG